MKPVLAFPLCIVVFAGSFIISSKTQFPVIWIMVGVTALWAAYDSDKIGLPRYRTELSHGPIVVFLACALLWVLGFPWYLSLRYQVKSGKAALKEKA